MAFSVFFLWPYFQICRLSLKTLIQKANKFLFLSDQKVIDNTVNHYISEQLTNLNKECKLTYIARIPVNSLPSNNFIVYHQFRYSVQDRFIEYHQRVDLLYLHQIMPSPYSIRTQSLFHQLTVIPSDIPSDRFIVPDNKHRIGSGYYIR